jgi:hypothetical protein
MFTLAGIIVHLLEGAAVTGAIYLVTRRALAVREVVTLILTISVTFMILDMFAPAIGVGARQGSGFGLGFMQFAGDGNTMPRRYYDPKSGQIIEGMDDPAALEYYSQYNPQQQQVQEPQQVQQPQQVQKVQKVQQPNLVIAKDAQTPSVILQEYAKSPFDTDLDNKFAPFPN